MDKVGSRSLFGSGSSSAGKSSEGTDHGRTDPQFPGAEPLYCECARTGKRPLSWAPWVPGLSANALSDSINKEFAHEHLIFDQSRDNIGFGPKGLFSEDLSDKQYRLDRECYNGTVMRAAIRQTEPPSAYLFVMQNCQTYVERVRDTYARLIKQQR